MNLTRDPVLARSTRSVDAVLLGVAVMLGSSYLAAKTVTPADGVLATLVLRFAVATAAMVVLLLPRLRRLSRDEVRLGGGAGLVLSAIFTLETFGVTRTSAANAGLIISSTIIFTPLLQSRLTGRDVGPAFYGCAVVAMLGVTLLTQSNGLQAPRSGDILMLLAALARALHVVLIAQCSRGRCLDSGRMTAVQLSVGLVVFLLASAVSGPTPQDVASRFTGGDWVLLVYLALGCTVAAFFAQTWAVRATSPSRVSLLLGTEPLWALLFGFSLTGQPVTAMAAGGATLVLLGVTAGRRTDRLASSPPPSGRGGPVDPAAGGPVVISRGLPRSIRRSGRC